MSEFGDRISAAYAAKGKALDLGRGVVAGATDPSAVVQLSAAMCNRHGLIAGATGTGKTKTLQLMAEQLSAMGVSVFGADMKGDLSGIAEAGAHSERVDGRVAELGVTWEPAGRAVQFLALGGQGAGVPVRATISSFGPTLLAKVMDANETQSSSLSLVFRYADDHQLGLLDLADLRAVLQFLLSDDGKADLKGLGGLSSATAGVLLRKIVELEELGAEPFFGEPQLEVADLIGVHPDGTGLVSCLELPSVQDRPRLFSTFLLWLLAELFETLPEVGDLDQPKLVFFFDEAHLLFDGASKPFREQIAQTVRLIRSKGVGVFFITQLPDDVPDEILAQLGNRIQHALRAFTPRDAKALKAAVTTYPKTSDYDLEEDLTKLGTGEAMVTTLSESGSPTPVVWTKLRPPASKMAALAATAITAHAQALPIWTKYAVEIDRQSARELLDARVAQASAPATPAPSVPLPMPSEPRSSGSDMPPRPGAPKHQPAAPKPDPQPRAKAAKKEEDGAISGYLKSREGRTMMNRVVRGVFDMLKK